MRKAYSKQRQLDSVPIDQVELNLECRDSIIPVLRALQQVYSDWASVLKTWGCGRVYFMQVLCRV